MLGGQLFIFLFFSYLEIKSKYLLTVMKNSNSLEITNFLFVAAEDPKSGVFGETFRISLFYVNIIISEFQLEVFKIAYLRLAKHKK